MVMLIGWSLDCLVGCSMSAFVATLPPPHSSPPSCSQIHILWSAAADVLRRCGLLATLIDENICYREMVLLTSTALGSHVAGAPKHAHHQPGGTSRGYTRCRRPKVTQKPLITRRVSSSALGSAHARSLASPTTSQPRYHHIPRQVTPATHLCDAARNGCPRVVLDASSVLTAKDAVNIES